MRKVKAGVRVGRALFRPKYPEVADQCSSCPFREGNDAEFGEILTKLKVSITPGRWRSATAREIAYARAQVHEDVSNRGDFFCHHTVYDAAMEKKPAEGWRQCKGATAAFRGS